MRRKTSRTPNANSLRAKLLARFVESPTVMVTRKEIVDGYGVGITAVENAICRLKRDGYITAHRQADGTVGYLMVGAAPPVREVRAVKPKPIRRWTETSYYEPPRPIPNSIFSLAASMGVA